MRLKLLELIVAFIVFLVCLTVMTPARPLPLSVRVWISVTNVAGLQTVEAVVSNASPDVIIYDNGPLLQVASLSSGEWATNTSGRSVTGYTLLQPGSAVKTIDLQEAIPHGATAMRVGLSFTIFSWRSRLAWKIQNARFLGSAASFLFRLDKSKRSETEWSDVVALENPGPAK